MTKPSIATATQVTVITYEQKAIGGEAEVYGGSSTSAPAVAYEGRYYVKTSVTRGIYKYTNHAWTRMTAPTNDMVTRAAYDIMIAVNAGLGVIADYIDTGINFQIALIQRLFAEHIMILSGGSVYGGTKYDENGNATTASSLGFWIGANGQIKAAGVELSGAIAASSGSIATFVIDSDSIYTGSKVLSGNYASAGAMTLGADGHFSANQFRIDSDGAAHFVGAIAIGSADTIFKADSNGIYLGDAIFADAPFKVAMDGVMEAIGAVIRGTAIIDNGLFNGSLNTGAFKSESSSEVATWTVTSGSWLGSAFYTAFSTLALGAVVSTTVGGTYGTSNVISIQRITGSMKIYTDDGKVFSVLNDNTSYSVTGSITTIAGGTNYFKNSILVDPDATAGTVVIGTNDSRFASVFADGMRADTFYADESFSTAGAFNSYKIDDDTSPIARKTATDGAALTFTVYKSINVRAIYDGTSSIQLFIRNNGSYNIEYVLVPSSGVYKVFPMMPGNYRITTGAGYTLTLDCIGVYGSTDGSAIWS